jgi:hypothetical protein
MKEEAKYSFVYVHLHASGCQIILKRVVASILPVALTLYISRCQREKTTYREVCDSKLSLIISTLYFFLTANLIFYCHSQINCHILKDLLSSFTPSMFLSYILIKKQVKYIMFLYYLAFSFQ